MPPIDPADGITVIVEMVVGVGVGVGSASAKVGVGVVGTSGCVGSAPRAKAASSNITTPETNAESRFTDTPILRLRIVPIEPWLKEVCYVDTDQGIGVGDQAIQLACQGGAGEQPPPGRVPDPSGDGSKGRRGHVYSWEDF